MSNTAAARRRELSENRPGAEAPAQNPAGGRKAGASGGAFAVASPVPGRPTPGVGGPGAGGPVGESRARGALADAALLVLAALQLLPFLAAFHQSADDNFWQFVALLEGGNPSALWDRIGLLAREQGRVGMFPAMPLVLLGTMVPEYAWGRVLVVLCFGAVLLAFQQVLGRRFGLPLARPALLLALCITPLAAHHLPPNAYPLMLTLPLLGLLLLHLRLADGAALSGRARLAAGALTVALTLMLEYALVEGIALAALAVLTAGRGRVTRALLLHGPALLASALIYAAFRAAYPSHYAGTIAAAFSLPEIARLQVLHALNGTIFPHLAGFAPGRTDLALAALVLVLGAGLAHRLLPALARVLPPGVAARVGLACLGWAWLNTLPHALTAKYQDWCRLGDCTYVDSRIGALGAGAAAAVFLGALLGALNRRGGRAARFAVPLCALVVGLLGAATLLHNRASARSMAERERPFVLLREAACRADGWPGWDPVFLRTLAGAVLWPAPPDPAAAERFLATYRDNLPRLGLNCRPVPFVPPPPTVALPGWSGIEAGGRWSVAPAGVLLLSGEAATRGAVLTLGAFAPPGRPAQRVLARTGNGTGCAFVLDGSPRTVVLPGEPGLSRVLILETPDALSPLEAGESADGRRLGVFLAGARPLAAGEGTVPGLDLRRCTEVR